MKKVKCSKQQIGTLTQLNSQLKSSQQLDLNQMRAICGGDGEDNGGSEIIIPLPPAKPKCV